MHVLSFDDGRVELLLYFGDVASGLREIVAGVDAFYLDGFSPARMIVNSLRNSPKGGAPVIATAPASHSEP